MKRYAICVFALLCSLFPLAAQSIPVVQDYSAEGEELKSSMKNFANNANSMGTGRGYIGIYYSPVGTKDLMLTANFSLLGVWGMELGGGYSFLKKTVELTLDPLNLVWTFPLSESFSWSVGAGCPLLVTLLSDEGDIEGIRPFADLQFHLFASSDYGLSIFARPGYLFDWQKEKDDRATGFTCPIGIAFRMPASFIAQALSSAL